MSIAAAAAQPNRVATSRLLAANFTACSALAITGAAFNGVSFVNNGQAFSSMIMAGLWAVAMACYLTNLFYAARAHIAGRI